MLEQLISNRSFKQALAPRFNSECEAPDERPGASFLAL